MVVGSGLRDIGLYMEVLFVGMITFLVARFV